MSASADNDEYYDRVISTSSTSSSSSNARQIGYGIVPSSNNSSHKNAAIVLFYPLSGCSLAISRAAASFRDYQCHVICVDRPDCGATSALLAPDDNNDDDSIDFAVHRIRGHANDVMEVLTHEGIEQVYLLGVCLGHPYALEVGRRLLLDTQKLQICGLTLVAPFVSTASPHSWRVARLGAAVPSLVLYCCTESLLSVSSILTPMLLRPSMIERMVTPHEKETFGWTTDGSDDFSDSVDLILEMQSRTTNARGTEARLGVTPSWQRHVCDAFASGCGLIADESKVTTNQCQFPIRIHVSRKDKLAAIESVEWIADRCFGGRDVITIEEDIRSHELMTMFGGPPRNPILMHQIARNWGLLLEADKEE